MIHVGQQIGIFVVEKELRPRHRPHGRGIRVFRIRCNQCGSTRKITSSYGTSVVERASRCRHCPKPFCPRGPYGPYRIDYSSERRNVALTNARLASGLTQREIDQRIGAPYPFINYVERYNWKFITDHCSVARMLRYVTEVADLLKVPVETVIDPITFSELVFNDEKPLRPLPKATPEIQPEPDPAEQLEIEEALQLVCDAVKYRLSAREREMLYARIWSKESLEQIGSRYNLTRERARQTVNTAFRKICRYLSQQYIELFELTRTKGDQMNSYFRLKPV